jgi:ubiquinone/menaquinone biosynthesis C-methylase UbiE
MIGEPTSVADAYSRTGAAWQAGPGAIYDRLAEVLVDCRPDHFAGRVVLDLGAGTGAASRAITAAGGVPIALDAAYGMLAADHHTRPPAVVGDAYALPLRDDAFDAVVAAFSLNHLDDPAAGLREAARVTRRGGALLASAYADDDSHPVKQAVESAAREAGWQVPQWYTHVRAATVPQLATVASARDVLAHAGLQGTVHKHAVRFDDLGPEQLLAWRFGMAHIAPFVATLDDDERAAMVDRARQRLEDVPLVRSIIVVVAVAPGSRPAAG